VRRPPGSWARCTTWPPRRAETRRPPTRRRHLLRRSRWALTLAGAKPWEPLAPDRENLLRAALNGASFHLQPTLRSLWPGSPQPVRRALLAGPSYAMKVVAGAAPQGFVSTESIVSGSSWPGWGRLSSLRRRGALPEPRRGEFRLVYGPLLARGASPKARRGTAASGPKGLECGGRTTSAP
jgi:hypothetical protein